MVRGFSTIAPFFVFVLAACSVPKAQLGQPCQLYGSAKETCDRTERKIVDINKQKFSGNKILLISDNQQALVPVKPIFEQSKIAERTVNTAHRRPALDAFALDVMNHIIKKSGANLIIHGGDLLNNSCVEEFERAKKVLNQGEPEWVDKKQTPQWFIVPGNHDGYYLGISSPKMRVKDNTILNNFILDESIGWEDVCTNLADPKKGKQRYKNYANKATYVRLYLHAIGVVDHIHKNPHAITDAKLSRRYESNYQNGDNEHYDVKCVDFTKGSEGKHGDYMTNVCWTEKSDDELKDYAEKKIEGKTLDDEYKYPWMNFVIQRLEIELDGTKNPTQIILVDTASYVGDDDVKAGIAQTGEFRKRTNGAADVGYVSEVQLEIIDSLVHEDKDTIIFGHHPLFELERGSFNALTEILEKKIAGREFRYISGDTHDGYNVNWPYRSSVEPGKRLLINEINMGSTLDAPIEYAYLGRGKGGQTIIQHFSLTPVEDTARWAKKGALKSTRNEYPKKYLEFDNDLFDDTCEHEFTSYEKAKRSDDRSDPLLTKLRDGREVFGSGFRVPQPGDVSGGLGFAYILNLASWRDVRENSLYIYKINRLSDLTEVYIKLFEHSGLYSKLSDTVVQNLKEAENDYLSLAIDTFQKYPFDRKSSENPFKRTLKSLAVAVDSLEAELDKHRTEEKVQTFMLCSALYEAEREYKVGLFQQVNVK